MARAGSLSSIGSGLIRADRRARDLSGNGSQDKISFQRKAAFAHRLARDHEGGQAGLHIGRAETECLPVSDGSLELGLGIQFPAKHEVFFGPGEARVHMSVDHEGSSVFTAFQDSNGVDSIGIDFLANGRDAMTGIPIQNELANLPFRSGRAGNVYELLGQFGRFLAAYVVENFFSVFFTQHFTLLRFFLFFHRGHWLWVLSRAETRMDGNARLLVVKPITSREGEVSTTAESFERGRNRSSKPRSRQGLCIFANSRHS